MRDVRHEVAPERFEAADVGDVEEHGEQTARVLGEGGAADQKAARLEAANKFLGTRICVSASIAEGADNFNGRPVGDLVLRGRSEPLRAYEPWSVSVFQGLATAQYCAAFRPNLLRVGRAGSSITPSISSGVMATFADYRK